MSLQSRADRTVYKHQQCHPATLDAFGGIQSFNAHLLMKCLSVDTCGYFHCGSLDSKICLVITRMSQTGCVCVCVCVCEREREREFVYACLHTQCI